MVSLACLPGQPPILRTHSQQPEPLGRLVPVRHWQSWALRSLGPVLLLGAHWKVKAISAPPAPAFYALPLAAVSGPVGTCASDLGYCPQGAPGC